MEDWRSLRRRSMAWSRRGNWPSWDTGGTPSPRPQAWDGSTSRPRTVRRHIQLAEDLKVFDLREMQDLLGRTKGHRGQAKVRAALELYDERPVFTRSGLERRFLEVVREAGLPEPAMNLFVAGYEIDAYWTDQRFGVELDVYETHGSRLSFEEDRERDDELLLAGSRRPG